MDFAPDLRCVYCDVYLPDVGTYFVNADGTWRCGSVKCGERDRAQLGICPHCEQADGVERYMLGQLPATATDARWLGKREAKARAAA
jgi:hypothetical protein